MYMKKQCLMLAGILALSLSVAGCGKKEAVVEPQIQATATPAPTLTPTTGAQEGELVEMQKSEDSDITNIIGQKTATASKVILVNQTGADISGIYFRGTIDDDEEWGTELVQGKFVLKNGEKALYYYDPSAKDLEGNTISTYDIRITYADEDRNDCYFRKLPLRTISQITLCMDETEDYSIPYARYITGSSKKEFSTLNEVKKRLGLLDSEGESDEEDEETPTPTPTPYAAAVTPTPAPTETPADNGNSQGDEMIRTAESYIGQSLDALISACGEPSGSDYEEEPETGETGYHYYNNFTVSTTVDENGNEIVAGVW